MIPLKDYIFRAPNSVIDYYVNTRRICEIILRLASQYGPNKKAVSNYIKKNGNIASFEFSERQLPDILSESIACDYIFRELLNEEIDKVNKFTATKHEEIYREIMKIGKQIRSEISIPVCEYLKEYKRRQKITNENFNQLNYNYTTNNIKLLDEFESSLNHLSNEIIHLDFYIRTNFKILTRLCRFFDMMLQTSTSVWFQTHLTKEPFVDINIDILLILLSLSWTRYRDAEKVIQELKELGENKLSIEIMPETDTESDNISGNKNSVKEVWKPPETFLRNTTKYWVHPNNVVSAKAGIIRYVPYLIFGVSNSELETLLDPYMCVEGHNVLDPKTIEESQAITSVYLDNVNAECYNNRISRFEDAQLFRLRWYGSNSGSKEKEIFMERKTHHESWTGEKSAKERFSLPQKYVFGYLKGKFNVDSLIKEGIFYTRKSQEKENTEKSINLAKEIQNYINNNRLQPFVRTSYLRAAFQNQDNNQVRFSIDTNLCMVNEYISDGHQNEPWCRLAEEVLSKNEVTRFPFAILEVKLQSEQPIWVSEMLKRCNATLVYKFSKFQHGMAILHQDKVSIFPHWIEDFHQINNIGILSSTSISELSYSKSNDNDDNVGNDLSDIISKSQKYPNNIFQTRKRDLANLQLGVEDEDENNRMSKLIDILLNSYLNMTSFDLHGLKLEFNTSMSYSQNLHYDNDNRNVEDNETNIYNSYGQYDEKNDNSNIEFIDQYINSIQSKKIKKLDPKSLFAAERVMLYWVRKTIYISTFVILLISKTKKKTNLAKISTLIELSFIPIIITTLIFGLFVYIKRINTIERRMVKSLENEKERIDYPKSSLYIFTTSCLILVFSLILNSIN
ncbi:polyphosphate synthetase VTC4 [Cryptosporidium sp. chipmunk genotype I]|uniref:polyphosphate synthetase VTC4 n=1 Tax=Cryptosporidium sp. chipmunk genotype I TaxID=1280935 RepID=UPI00351A2DF2|nr:polyphosphate synthetase VTC4 [Cryptosporidium sp. chipmunk genotype I]